MASSNSRPASAKRTSTRKASAKKTSAKKTSAKEATSAAEKAASSTRSSSDSPKASKSSSGSTGRRSSAPRAEPRPEARAGQVAAQAASELLELTGKGAEGVTALERTDDGWTVQVEVVEVRRIPDTTDILALYEVTTDKQGSMLGYRRLRRYARGVPGND